MPKFKLKRRNKPAPFKLKVRIKIGPPPVVPPTAALPVRMVGASEGSKLREPTMQVTIQKPIHSVIKVKVKRKGKTLLIRKKGTIPLHVENWPFTGTLFHWAAIPLVCHRSPYHDREWIVSEFTTGRNVCSNFKGRPKRLHAGSCPTEAEARFEAVFYLQRMGLKSVKRQIKSLPKLNTLTPKMVRYIQRDWGV